MIEIPWLVLNTYNTVKFAIIILLQTTFCLLGCNINWLFIQKCLYRSSKIKEQVPEREQNAKYCTAKGTKFPRSTFYHGTRKIKEDHTYFAVEFIHVIPHPSSANTVTMITSLLFVLQIETCLIMWQGYRGRNNSKTTKKVWSSFSIFDPWPFAENIWKTFSCWRLGLILDEEVTTAALWSLL